jgi:hypothetical protein
MFKQTIKKILPRDLLYLYGFLTNTNDKKGKPSNRSSTVVNRYHFQKRRLRKLNLLVGTTFSV